MFASIYVGAQNAQALQSKSYPSQESVGKGVR